MTKEYTLIFPEPVMDIPNGWIQWKGTDVCIDIHCVCGSSYHFDGEYFYHCKCATCGRYYQVGQNVRLYEVDPEDLHKWEKNVHKIIVLTEES